MALGTATVAAPVAPARGSPLSTEQHDHAGREASESPALRRERSMGTAREIKFRVDLDRLGAITEILDRRLRRDPHGDASLDGDYRVTSLYCDTGDLEVYRRVGWHRFRKFRVRRYGAGDQAYLERKTRLGELVRKERIALPIAELRWLDESASPPADWIGSDYRRQIHRRSLGPACLIDYRRRAFFGDAPSIGGALPIRVTIDREMRAAPARAWDFAPRDLGPLAESTMVIEIKCGSEMLAAGAALPVAVKELIEVLRLGRRGISKYRQGVRSLAAAATDNRRVDEDDRDA